MFVHNANCMLLAIYAILKPPERPHGYTATHLATHSHTATPDTHTERRAYSLGGTYTADAFRAFTPVNGIQYFVSDTEYQEYITDNDTEHADGAQ